jgi:DnaJ-related protein SCJ1
LFPFLVLFHRANTPHQDPFSIFEHFGFGGFGGFGGAGRHEEQRTATIEIPVRVTLRQLYLGELLDVEYVRQVVCVEASSCEKNNKECQGPGIKLRVQQIAPGFVQQVQVSDPSCVAKGKAWKSPCKACPNGMTEDEEIQLTLDIQSGMKDGDTIKFDSIADEAVGHIPGDVVFIIKQTPDSFYTRQGDDLYMTMTITLQESLIGFEKTFPHLDEHSVIVKKNDVTYCAETIVIKGEGMPKRGNKSSHGDLYITFNIDFPRQFTDKQKELIKQAMASS